MPLAAPNNCWPNLLQKFADAVANSAAFQAMARAADEVEATSRIFGKRLTYSRDGRRYTREQLEELFGYAQVYGDPNSPYGKHIGGGMQYHPHGQTCIILARIVTDLEGDKANDSTGLTEIHDRDWQNIAGTVADEVLSWLKENGGPKPVLGFDVTLDDETPAVHQGTQGCWQGCEFTFSWREGGGS